MDDLDTSSLMFESLDESIGSLPFYNGGGSSGVSVSSLSGVGVGPPIRKMVRRVSFFEAPSALKAHHAQRSFRQLARLTDYKCEWCSDSGVRLRLCGNCRTAAYCSERCQSEGWTAHRQECKRKNPAHFDPDHIKTERMRLFKEFSKQQSCEEIAQGGDALSEAEEHLPLSFIVDAFKIRCCEEQELTYECLDTRNVVEKLTRFLYAAKGCRILPDTFRYHDFMSVRNDAFDKYKVNEILEPVRQADLCQHYSDPYEALLILKQLHQLVCGPLIYDSLELNLI